MTNKQKALLYALIVGLIIFLLYEPVFNTAWFEEWAEGGYEFWFIWACVMAPIFYWAATDKTPSSGNLARNSILGLIAGWFIGKSID